MVIRYSCKLAETTSWGIESTKRLDDWGIGAVAIALCILTTASTLVAIALIVLTTALTFAAIAFRVVTTALTFVA
jgi:hypothetical protein